MIPNEVLNSIILYKHVYLYFRIREINKRNNESQYIKNVLNKLWIISYTYSNSSWLVIDG